MVWVKPELPRRLFPGFRDELEGCEAFECLEAPGEAVGVREGFQVGAEAVERFFNKLKHFSAVATRCDKRDNSYLASVKRASLRIWLRSYESVA